MELNYLIKFLKNANAPSSLIDFVVNNIKIDEKLEEKTNNIEKKSQKSRKKKVK